MHREAWRCAARPLPPQSLAPSPAVPSPEPRSSPQFRLVQSDFRANTSDSTGPTSRSPSPKMLRLSKKADYALMAMRHLAASEPGSSSSAREIAESYAIPSELLAKVLQRLVRARLLRLGAGHPRRLQARAAGHADDRGRRHPGHRRPGRRHRVLADQPHLRAVRALRDSRPALEDQVADRRRAGHREPGRAGRARVGARGGGRARSR